MTFRRWAISAFVALWLGVFFYETFRRDYLVRWLGRDLPKVRFLYPPAGWIMFYRVDEGHGSAEVYGRRGERGELIDPHRIFANRWVGYDNIRRNVLISALDSNHAPQFCGFLRRKFPEYDGFLVIQAWIPSVVLRPDEVLRRLAYRC